MGCKKKIILILHPIVPELRQRLSFYKPEVPSLMNFLVNKKLFHKIGFKIWAFSCI
jgi:hypothetical protein